MGQGGGFVNGDADGLHAGVGEAGGGDFFGEGFDELATGFDGDGDGVAFDAFVVDGVGELSGLGGAAGVAAEGDVHPDFARGVAFGGVDAEDALGADVAEVNPVVGRGLAHVVGR